MDGTRERAGAGAGHDFSAPCFKMRPSGRDMAHGKLVEAWAQSSAARRPAAERNSQRDLCTTETPGQSVVEARIRAGGFATMLDRRAFGRKRSHLRGMSPAAALPHKHPERPIRLIVPASAARARPKFRRGCLTAKISQARPAAGGGKSRRAPARDRCPSGRGCGA